MVFHAAWPLAEGQPPLPFVYVSRHGETSRTFSILNDLARDEPLSPTQFSLSVHNAVIGLWSILRADNSEMTALACEGDGLQYGALEAEALLAEGAPAVLLVVAEEQPDAVYDDWIDDVPFSYATAFRLCKGHDWTLSRQTRTTHDEPYTWPHALNLIQVLSSQSSFCQNQGKGHLWTWQRNA
ncbi:3-oxoacyl-ACP synthase [Pseudomonas matsuisoli]|uniref:3-oxoacyl-ACP synthase n=2 Tax=Pseudomonas matsuisoli TaxID=1515666 RepID=A0A917PYE1_9PSED|nr:3-oxoacyl-ACP synthase [Pseudomonas matsuisoli]